MTLTIAFGSDDTQSNGTSSTSIATKSLEIELIILATDSSSQVSENLIFKVFSCTKTIKICVNLDLITLILRIAAFLNIELNMIKIPVINPIAHPSDTLYAYVMNPYIK